MRFSKYYNKYQIQLFFLLLFNQPQAHSGGDYYSLNEDYCECYCFP